MPRYVFHPDAEIELDAAIEYYLQEGSPELADAFLTAVESGVREVLASPDRWRVMEEPDFRRYLLRRFPYALYYRWKIEDDRVTIYAVVHGSREPGYWKYRAAW
jgi:plasmid stabilization system protein ParE